MRLSATLAAFMAAYPITSAEAHPHVFVDVLVTVIYEGATPVGVQLDWTYDDYFSLLVTADLGVDLDGDLALTPAEAELVNATLTQWPSEDDGHLKASQSGQTLRLGAPESHRMTYENGVLRETHIRPLLGATDAPLTLGAFDPFYYVDYHLAGPVQVVGRTDCAVQVTPPDLNEAYSMVDELLYNLPTDQVEDFFPQVGEAFADTIVVTCAV